MEIVKKCYSDLFESILIGKKKFDMRIAEEDYREGDILILKEIDKNRNFTGREISKKIGFVLKTKDCDFYKKEDIDKFGFVVLGFE